MIHTIRLGNYKAFKSGEIKIKPITILLGTNSAGKSSLIQLLLMITQTFSSRKNRQNILQLNGDLVKLGENKNIFHNKKTSSNIRLCFDISNIEYKRVIENVNERIFELFYTLDKIYSLITIKEDDNRIIRRARDIRYQFTPSFEEIMDVGNVFSKLSGLKRKINMAAKNLPSKEFEKIMDIYFRNMWRYDDSNIYSSAEKKIIVDFAPYKHASQFANTLSNIDFKNLEIEYVIKYNEKNRTTELEGFTINAKNQVILNYYYKNVRRGKHHVLQSDVFDSELLEKYSSKFGNTIDLTNLELASRMVVRRKRDNFFIEFLLQLIEQTISPIKDNFNHRNINYINPLRAYPRRYYFQDEVINSYSVSTVDSIQLIELFRERTDIKRKVNSWMKKFNINVDIDQLEEVIHKIRVHHSGLSLDITDVGFGISQVMPIIAQSYLARNNSITLIEQPEIHLHPKMQAELADLFIDTCKDDNITRNFIIETHSEYLLKRLRRRISDGSIDASDVAIYFIHPKNDSRNHAIIENVEISDTGEFEWPSDFYADDLKDTIEFLKNQI
ncbi:AAA family ATPase [Maribellus sediminis]|uniref:AAA family ATPase n=1 Tax=Maribellus sediminis TaxID=2696285 RepID=UPI0014322243|nr:AAA family ATPase [Maribellus sediminis]